MLQAGTPCVPLPAPGGRLRCGAASGTLRAGARGGLRAYGIRQAHRLAQNLGPFPQRWARAPQPMDRGGWDYPPHIRVIIQGQLSPGDLCRPRHPGKRPGPPDQVMDEVLGPTPVRRGPRPEPRVVVDGVPRQGANEVVPRVGVAGPWTRLVGKEGIPVTRLVPLAFCHAGCKDRHVHAVKEVQELVKEVPVHPLRQPEGKEARFPQAGRPLVRRSQVGDGLRHVAQPGEPRLPGIVPFWALPQDVGLVLMRRAVLGARGVGPRAVARHLGHCPHGPIHETAQQPLLELCGGCPQCRAPGWAVRPVAEPTESDRAPRLKLARGVAAKAVPDPVLEPAEWLLHKVQGVFLPWDVPAPLAFMRAPAQGGRLA